MPENLKNDRTEQRAPQITGSAEDQHDKRFGRALAFIAIPAQLAPVLGPVLGGVIIADLGWRWIFWINVPLTLLGLALARRWLPETSSTTRVRLDAIGLALLSPGLAFLLYGLSEASTPGAGSKVWLPMAAGGALLVAFIVHALRTRKDPLLDLRLFTNRAYAAGTSATFLLGLSLFGVCMWSNVIGSIVPLAASRVGIDPAVVSAPFISTLVDATGMVIYFTIAIMLLGLTH